MKTNTTTFDRITEAYAIYDRDVTAVLANLDRTTPTPLIRQLQNARAADRIARANPATAETAAEAEAAHEAARQAIEELDRIAHRITAAEADRIAAAQEAADLRTEADEARHTAADLAKVTARTLSDRADLVQVAAAADLEEPTPAEIAAAERTAEERGEDLTAEEIHEAAKRRHRRNAVARYIRAQKSGNALNGMHTDTRPATAEEVTAWRAAGKPTGAEHKQPTKGGYITLEYREQTAKRPAGWYFVNRRFTVNQWQSIEALTEDGNPCGIIRTQNTYTADLDAWERIEALTAAADLTAREREWLATFCGRAARQAGADARRAYHTENGTKATEAGAGAAEFAARRDYCMSRIGITDPANRRQFYSRMTRKLAAAVKLEATCTTPAEAAEHDRRYWERMQTDSRRGYATEPSRRPVLLEAVSRAAEGITTAPAVAWLTADEAADRAAQRAAEAAEAADNSRIDNTTKAARRAAKAAAAAYAAKHAAKARAAAEAAEATAKADRLQAAKTAAIRAGVCVTATTWEMWQGWTEEQRTAYMEYLTARTA